MRRSPALGKLRGDRRSAWADTQAALGQLLPTLVAIPLVFLLVRYRATVARTLVVLIDHLGRDAAARPSAPIGGQPPPAVSANLPTAGITGSAEVAERVAASPSAPVSPAAAPSPSPMPAPAVKSAPTETSATTIAGAETAGLDAVPGDGSLVCPDDFPVKGNATSKIYHLPGTSYYAMTKANVCFRSPEAAERAGFRASKTSPIRTASSTPDREHGV